MTESDPPTNDADQSGDAMSPQQVVALDDTALRSGALLEEGFRQLEKYRGEDETLNAILWNFSQGFEHLLKLTLWLFGEDQQSIGRGHDVLALLDKLLPRIPRDLLPAGRHEFLEGDARFRNLIEMLGRYGGSGKYNALDAAIDRPPQNPDAPSPEEMWEEIKWDLVTDDWMALMERDPGGFAREYYPYLYREVATSLAVGIHSLWWLWVHGHHAERGGRFHPSLTSGPRLRVNNLAMRANWPRPSPTS